MVLQHDRAMWKIIITTCYQSHIIGVCTAQLQPPEHRTHEGRILHNINPIHAIIWVSYPVGKSTFHVQYCLQLIASVLTPYVSVTFQLNCHSVLPDYFSSCLPWGALNVQPNLQFLGEGVAIILNAGAINLEREPFFHLDTLLRLISVS